MDRKKNSSPDRKNNRLFILIVACSAAGVVLGGTASWAESNQCLLAENPTSQCLTQDPVLNTLEGMSTGLVAGAAAALGATWQMKHKDE
jgi:hypothetical protein